MLFRNYSSKVRKRLGWYFLRGAQSLRIAFYRLCSNNDLQGVRPRLSQPVLCLGQGTITLASNVCIGVFPSPYFLTGVCHLEARGAHAKIVLGESTFINNDFTAIAEATSISVGKRCLIGPRVTIFDSDFHGLAVSERMVPAATIQKPVIIGNDVFIGAGSTILKGVSIGDGSVIAAGSMVSHDIPPGVIAAGNPARIVRSF